MAAIRSGVTPGCLARCFLRRADKQSRGSLPLSDIWNHRMLQKSRLHTAMECSGPASRTLLGRRQRGKLVWVNAVAVRYNSSQIPPEAVSMEASYEPPVVESPAAALPADPTPIIAEQVPVEAVTTAVAAADKSAPALSDAPLHHVSTEAVSAAPTAADVLQAASTEPSLADLGLANFTPVGFIQNVLEFIHIDFGLPWWGAIVVGTVIARMAVFPVIVKGQREAAKLNNVLPEMTKLSVKMTEARQSGNKFEYAKACTDLTLFQKNNDVYPYRGFLVPLVQAPVFISFFIALRKMAYLPVPSMQTGGMLWFMDLTAADPFFILPLCVTGTMFLTLELGADSGVDNPNLKTMKTVFRIMPFVILPLTINFPTAVFTYWLTSNCFSLAQVALLKHPLIRQKLRIPDKIKHPPSAMLENGGFIESMRKGWKNAQVVHQMNERNQRIKNHLDLAAKGPLRQTFTHNPLQQTPTLGTASAKGKVSVGKERPWKDTIV